MKVSHVNIDFTRLKYLQKKIIIITVEALRCNICVISLENLQLQPVEGGKS